MAELAHNLEYDVSLDWHAFGKVYAPGKRTYMNVHFTARPEYRGKPAPCCNTGEKELGIKFTHLILNWHKQCRFDWIHASV
jgi:hypothetical protein